MTNSNELNAPWSLCFDRNGTEDVGFILDRDGHELVQSRDFWLPEEDDPIPPTLASLRVMAVAPTLLDELTESTKLLHNLFVSARKRGNHKTANTILERIEANLSAIDQAENLEGRRASIFAQRKPTYDWE